ncbi:hypothetical protein [Ekhidna sp.]|uniref:hypothetical protein n=1 Tax=Ekhidna sp. TaxID=2608089 RepID=UPI003BAA01FE
MPEQTFIVGDAGGTGTQWRVVNDGNIEQFETIGFNAFTHSIADLKSSIADVFLKGIKKDTPVFFYAAGADTTQQCTEIASSLSSLFGNRVIVKNDLLGVARSLCGKEEGNVCILGTGANACYYNGEEVNKVSASLGYVLGDEGSGAYLGKKLLQGVFRKYFSDEVIHLFQNQYSLTPHEAIQKLYTTPKPNQLLASFAPFIHEHKHQPDMFRLITSSFEDFFDGFFRNSTSDLPFHFSGSVAYHFSDILREVGNERGFYIKNIVQSPISGLVLYHQKYE